MTNKRVRKRKRERIKTLSYFCLIPLARVVAVDLVAAAVAALALMALMSPKSSDRRKRTVMSVKRDQY